MRASIIFTIISFLTFYSGITDIKTITKTEVVKFELEYKFASKVSEKMENVYKYIINPTRECLGETYETSLLRYNDPSSHHYFKWFDVVAADFDNDVIDGASNKEIYELWKNFKVFDQLIVGNSTKTPAYVHVALKLKGKNRYQILIKKKYWSKKRRKWVTYYKKVNN